MSHRLIAATVLAGTVIFAAPDSADSGYRNWTSLTYPTTRYDIRVHWWFFDTDSYSTTTVQSFTSYQDALESLAFHEWLLENNYLNAYYDVYWRYIPIDVELKEARPWSQSRFGW